MLDHTNAPTPLPDAATMLRFQALDAARELLRNGQHSDDLMAEALRIEAYLNGVGPPADEVEDVKPGTVGEASVTIIKRDDDLALSNDTTRNGVARVGATPTLAGEAWGRPPDAPDEPPEDDPEPESDKPARKPRKLKAKKARKTRVARTQNGNGHAAEVSNGQAEVTEGHAAPDASSETATGPATVEEPQMAA